MHRPHEVCRWITRVLIRKLLSIESKKKKCVLRNMLKHVFLTKKKKKKKPNIFAQVSHLHHSDLDFRRSNKYRNDKKTKKKQKKKKKKISACAQTTCWRNSSRPNWLDWRRANATNTRGLTSKPLCEIKFLNLWKYLWLHHLSGKMSLVSADLVILLPGHGS